MIYLIEKFNLQKATPRNLDNFIGFGQHRLIPFYEGNHATLKMAWCDNGEELFQVGHLIEFKNIEACLKFYMLADENEKIQKELTDHISQRGCEVYQSGSPVFIEALNQAISESQGTPVKTCTIATLSIAPEQMNLLIPKQEGAAKTGMPLIAFLKAMTGNQNTIVDIWKGDLQEIGYQNQAFYESIGMPDEHWEWIRQMAPHEKMSRVHLLPYSPLK